MSRKDELMQLSIKELQKEINKVEKEIAQEWFYCGQVSGSQIRRRGALYYIANEKNFYKHFYDQVMLAKMEDIDDDHMGWVSVKSNPLPRKQSLNKGKNEM
jgi:hypothetical protein